MAIDAKNVLTQCWKFLSPGRPRRSDLGLGDLFSDAGSPDGRPEMVISQLLWGLQTSMTTQFAVQRVVAIKSIIKQLPHEIVILCPRGLSIFTQGYLVFESGRLQDYHKIITSFQRWLTFEKRSLVAELKLKMSQTELFFLFSISALPSGDAFQMLTHF